MRILIDKDFLVIAYDTNLPKISFGNNYSENNWTINLKNWGTIIRSRTEYCGLPDMSNKWFGVCFPSLTPFQLFETFHVLLSFLKWNKGPFIFYEEGGAGGISEAPFKNRMTPPQLTNFFTWAPPYSGHFLGWPPPQKKMNKHYLDFNFFNISLLSPYFTLLCSLWRQYLQSLYDRELLFKKQIKRKRSQSRIS